MIAERLVLIAYLKRELIVLFLKLFGFIWNAKHSEVPTPLTFCPDLSVRDVERVLSLALIGKYQKRSRRCVTVDFIEVFVCW